MQGIIGRSSSQSENFNRISELGWDRGAGSTGQGRTMRTGELVRMTERSSRSWETVPGRLARGPWMLIHWRGEPLRRYRKGTRGGRVWGELEMHSFLDSCWAVPGPHG